MDVGRRPDLAPGSTDLIRESAAKRGIEVRDFKLEAQFRANRL
jgi:hypothetical protein